MCVAINQHQFVERETEIVLLPTIIGTETGVICFSLILRLESYINIPTN